MNRASVTCDMPSSVPQKESREEKDTERMFEQIMAKNFPNLMKNISLHIQEVQQIPNRKNSNRSIPPHILTSLSKDNDKD